MPTAAKLVAGLVLGITAAVAAWLFVQDNAQNVAIGLRFIGGTGIVGFFVGWFSLGQNPGQSTLGGLFNGLRSLVWLLICVALVFSAIFVLTNLENNNFNEPMELPLLWIQIAFDYIVDALRRNIVTTLLIGGALAGVFAYHAGRRWT